MVDPFGRRVPEILLLGVRIWHNSGVFQARRECLTLGKNPGLRLVNANVREELAGAGVGDLRTQPRSHALNPRFEVIIRRMNYPCHPLEIDQCKYSQHVVFIDVKAGKPANIPKFPMQVNSLQANRPQLVGLPLPGYEVTHREFFGVAFAENNNFAQAYPRCP